MTQPKLTYFPVRGLAEPIRFILSYAGEDFVEEKIERHLWPAMKPSTPYGKLPMMTIDGKVIAQSAAICRYYAKKANIAGKNDFEAMLIDATVDAFSDLRIPIAAYFYEADETVKPKKHDILVKETIPLLMKKFEEQVKDNNGYFVNGKLSWADLYFAAIIDTLIYLSKVDLLENAPNLKALKDKVYTLPAIKAWVAKRPKTDY